MRITPRNIRRCSPQPEPLRPLRSALAAYPGIDPYSWFKSSQSERLGVMPTLRNDDPLNLAEHQPIQVAPGQSHHCAVEDRTLGALIHEATESGSRSDWDSGKSPSPVISLHIIHKFALLYLLVSSMSISLFGLNDLLGWLHSDTLGMGLIHQHQLRNRQQFVGAWTYWMDGPK